MRTARISGAYLKLLRHLGPWSAAEEGPRGFERYDVALPVRKPEHRPLRAFVYVPTRRRPLGAFLLCPGLHYAGPEEIRMDRLCRVLAAAGILVLAPFFPDFLALRVQPAVITDAEQALDALLALPFRPPGKPGVFSISFGGLPALALAARRPEEVGAVLAFGAYADFETSVRFALGGDSGDGQVHPRDPLNRPVVLMNLIDTLPGAEDKPALLAAWRRYVTSTWGRPELKVRERHQPIAEAIAAELPPALARLFLVGTGVLPGALELAVEAMRGRSFGFLDVRPYLPRIRCPLYLCHGADDDVIPHTQLGLLRAGLSTGTVCRTYLTGLYGHTGKSGLLGLLADLSRVPREAATMLGMLRALVRASRGR